MKKITIKTVCRKTLSDMVTPVGIYLRIRDRFRDTILLESTDFNSAENSWSFIGVNAIAGFEAVNLNQVEFKLPGLPPEKLNLKTPQGLVPAMNKFFARFEGDPACELPAAQSFFGYTSYDAVQFFDTIRFDNSKESTTSSNLLRYRLYQYVVAINHFNEELYLCENIVEGIEGDINQLSSIIFSRDVPVFPFAVTGPVSSNMTDEAYREMVREGIAACFRGDVFQIVLSRRFAQPFSGDEFNVYRALRSVNPSPYLFYFDYGDYRLFGSSPESQLIIDKGRAVVHPIAGTFRRTGNPEKDRAEAERLKNDAKENAEHVMLVDLARNDLSRHANEVEVSSYRKVHYFSHVIHLVSEVTGMVKDGVHPFDIMSDTFPAGTLSGAPKFKAMQLIDKLEPTARGYYGGAVGLIGLNGQFNHAIMIRTFMSRNNNLYCQAGAGVVAKSIPDNELEEVKNKLGALNRAVEVAATI